MASSEITATELEVSPHDDTDVYDDNLVHEQGEEEPMTADEFVDVETHEEMKCQAPEGTPVDTEETLPQDHGLQSEDEGKGAHKAAQGAGDREGQREGYCMGVIVRSFEALFILTQCADRFSNHPMSLRPRHPFG